MKSGLLTHGFLAVVAMIMAVMPFSSYAEGDKSDLDRQRIERAIKALGNGKGDWKLLTVTYDDLHSLHGGLTLTIHGNGKVEQTARRTAAGEIKTVTAAELRKLVELLYRHKAWEQRTPERPAIPDESRSQLIISYGNDTVTIWEWYNDMDKNKRIIEIREFMKKIAWKAVRKSG